MTTLRFMDYKSMLGCFVSQYYIKGYIFFSYEGDIEMLKLFISGHRSLYGKLSGAIFNFLKDKTYIDRLSPPPPPPGRYVCRYSKQN